MSLSADAARAAAPCRLRAGKARGAAVGGDNDNTDGNNNDRSRDNDNANGNDNDRRCRCNNGGDDACDNDGAHDHDRGQNDDNDRSRHHTHDAPAPDRGALCGDNRDGQRRAQRAGHLRRGQHHEKRVLATKDAEEHFKDGVHPSDDVGRKCIADAVAAAITAYVDAQETEEESI